LEDGIMKGAGEIALPAMVSTLCICIVFVPMFSLAGVARYLFVPLAEAVVFAVLSSYAISRTLVPTMIMFFESHHHKSEGEQHVPFWVKPFAAIQHSFEKAFERLKMAYGNVLGTILDHRAVFAACFLGFCVASWILVPFQGRNFFPSVDAGTFRLHVRAPTGTRIEQTAKLVDEVEASMRRQIPASELEGMIDNIGLPVSGINLSYNDSGVSGPADADILVSLNARHKPTANYVHDLRLSLNRNYPGIIFYFLPADIVTETINFGLPAPVDIQVVGRDQVADQKVANAIADKIRHVVGAVDVRVQQPNDLQRIMFEVDRTKAAQLGLMERDVANSVLLALSGSSQVTPTYWLDPASGIQYLVNVRVPEPATTTLSGLESMPISASVAGMGNGQVLSNLATFSRTTSQSIYSHYDVMPVVDVFANVGARDLGGVLTDIKPIIADAKNTAPKGVDIVLRGQAATMTSSFVGLSIGMLMSIALIYLLLVINFQSWLDPFIILTALTGALAGVVWGLHITSTPLSVPAMMGAIMCLGVATANSVLVVTFARNHLEEGMTPLKAAWEAGTGRLRPVIMTATAMIIGMFPMALSLGEGGEQNAPLGRAVIGGLLLATVATLFFVPVVFSLLHKQAAVAARAEPKEESPGEGLRSALPAT
jgi:multidrug efflux pump subunit AcrB